MEVGDGRARSETGYQLKSEVDAHTMRKKSEVFEFHVQFAVSRYDSFIGRIIEK